MSNPNRPARSPSIPIPASSRRNIEDILIIEGLTQPIGGIGGPSGPSTSPQRDRNPARTGSSQRSLYGALEGGSGSGARRSASTARSVSVAAGQADMSTSASTAVGAGSWGAQRGSWTPRSVSSAAPRSISGFEPRVIRASTLDAALAGVGEPGFGARPQAQRRDSGSGVSMSPTRARRPSGAGMPPSPGPGISRNPTFAFGTPVQGYTPVHARTVSVPITTTPSTVPSLVHGHIPPSILSSNAPFLPPAYLQHSALRELIHTDATAGSAHTQGYGHELGVGRSLSLAHGMSTRRDLTPMSDSDEDSESSITAVGGRLQRSRDRGRVRERLNSTTSFVPPDPVLRLPTRWSEQDRNKYLTVSEDGRTLHFNGPPPQGEKDSAAARANFPVPPACGIYYFEVLIEDRGQKGHISIGFSAADVRLTRLPGWEKNSWGYHGDDGHAFASERAGAPFGPRFSNGDTIGCGIDFTLYKVFYTRNGILINHVFENVGKDVALFPAVGLRTPNEAIRVNFGQDAFAYNIDFHVHEARERVWKKIMSTPIKWTIDDAHDIFTIEADKPSPSTEASGSATDAAPVSTDDAVVKSEADAKGVKQEPLDDDFVPLVSPPDYRKPINKLIMSYLTHHGYERTARAFQAQNAQQERRHLQSKSGLLPSRSSFKLERDADVDVKMEEDDDSDLRLGLHGVPPSMADDDGPFDMDGLVDERDDGFATRQRIVAAVHAGDIDRVLSLAQAECPAILARDDGLMLLKLRCRKFVELMLATAEALKKVKQEEADGAVMGVTAMDGVVNGAAGPGKSREEDRAMDVDDEEPQTPGTIVTNGLTKRSAAFSGSVTIPNGASAVAPRTIPSLNSGITSNITGKARARTPAVFEYQTALQAAFACGRKLQEDHKADARPEVQALLKRTFSLVTYDDPAEAGGDVAELASQEARSRLAQEVNQAILESQGRRSRPALERIYRQASAIIVQLALMGVGGAAFADMSRELLE